MTVKAQTPEAIARLPKWVQEHITNLERALEVAVKALDQYVDDQTPSPFQVQDLLCLAKNKTVSRYVQASTMNVTSGGVTLSIYPEDDGIHLMYRSETRAANDVAIVPCASNALNIRRVTFPDKG
jgi:hypothetical protein